VDSKLAMDLIVAGIWFGYVGFLYWLNRQKQMSGDRPGISPRRPPVRPG
jgi:hypothetical protein